MSYYHYPALGANALLGTKHIIAYVVVIVFIIVVVSLVTRRGPTNRSRL